MKKQKTLYGLLTIALIAIVFIGINQLFISHYIFKSVLNSHTETMSSVLSIAKTGIENYLSSLMTDIAALTVRSEIIDFDSKGKQAIDTFSKHYTIFSNVTRIGSEGNLLYTAPFDSASIGRNVLYQEHNKRLFRQKKPVISAPFDAVQGYKAIAIAVPVFRQGKMDGSVTGLIPFERIWNLYVSRIPITEHSIFIIYSNDGKIIYSIGLGNEDKLSDIHCTYSTLNDTTPLRDAQTGDIIAIEGMEHRDFLVLAEEMYIDQNTWRILSLSSMTDLRAESVSISNIQRLFTYIIIVLFVIIAAVFLILTGIQSQRMDTEIRETREQSKKIDREKLFFKNILEHMLKTRNVLIVITDNEGEIQFISSQFKSLKGNIFSIIGIEQAQRLKQSLKIANINQQGFMSLLNMGNRGIDNRFLFSITPIHNDRESYIVFIGFPYGDNLDSDMNREMNTRIMEWFNSDIPKATVDIDGRVILKNSRFSELYSVVHLFDLCGNACRQRIIEAIGKAESSLAEHAIDVVYNGNNLTLRFTPIVNPLLKVEFIAVEIH